MKVPQLDLNQIKFQRNPDNDFIEFGLTESYLSQPITTYIQKYIGIIRDTDSEKINLTNLVFSFQDGGFAIKGDVEVQFRKRLSEAPIIGQVYTPWMTVGGSFVEELSVQVIENKLNVTHEQITLSTNDSWYKKLFEEFVVPYLENEVVKQINEQLSNFNGMSLEELAWKYGKDALQQKMNLTNLSEDKMKTFLQMANSTVNRFDRLKRIQQQLASKRVNARVTQEYLWLSLV